MQCKVAAPPTPGWHMARLDSPHPVDFINYEDSPTSCFPLSQLLTFDQGGVSGHPNHQAVQRGVAFFQQCHSSRTTQPAGAVEVYQLETASVLLKYHPVLALLAALIRAALGHRLHIHINWRPWQAWRALRAHHSQMVWWVTPARHATCAPALYRRGGGLWAILECEPALPACAGIASCGCSAPAICTSTH